jgi:hypothetical protein
MKNDLNAQHAAIVWWMIWAALLSGIFVIYFTVGSSAAPAPSASPDSPVWMVGFAPFVVSTLIRWLLLPRFQSAQSAFPVFVVGLALAEMSCILGVFVFPAHKAGLFVLSVLGILQFVPYFAGRFGNPEA